jgi:MYXO-CTERM domain-containing protein
MDLPTTVKPICDLGEGDLNLYFLPAANTTEASGIVEIYGQYLLKIDKSPPTAPRDVNAGVGETAIPITWTVTSGDVANNMLIWDTDPVGALEGDGGAGGDTECSSSILMQDDDTDLAALMKLDNIRMKEVVGSVQTTTVSGSELGARRVAMAVVAEDLAGNISKISNVDCLQVVATDGFWDIYKAEGGTAEPGCACSTPGTRASLASGIVPIALVMLAWGVRRRKRRGSRS